jgi:hypothetical protein
LNKTNGIIKEKPTIEEIEQRNKRNRANFRELHKTAFNAYMNNLSREKYKNGEAYREKRKEYNKLRIHKSNENKTAYNAYMKDYMRERYRTNAVHRNNELIRKNNIS